MKNSIIFNDISGLGRCSLSVQLPIISTMKITTCPVPTGVFSCQSGFTKFHYTDLGEQVKKTIKDMMEMNIFFDGILAGFMMNESQLLVLDNYLNHPSNKNSLVLIDPILGDNGKQFRFFNQSYLKKLQETVRHASVITPNLTELCLLSDTDYQDIITFSELPIEDYVEKIAEIAEPLFSDKLKTVIVTGVHKKNNDETTSVHNVLVNSLETRFTSAEYKVGNFSGTGDILAAMMFGYLMNDTNEVLSVERTSEFLQEVINKSVINHISGKFGTDFELELQNIRL